MYDHDHPVYPGCDFRQVIDRIDTFKCPTNFADMGGFTPLRSTACIEIYAFRPPYPIEFLVVRTRIWRSWTIESKELGQNAERGMVRIN